MKLKYISVGLLMLTAFEGMAQQSKISYFMENSTSRIEFNPALNPKDGFVSVPGLGNISASVSSNTLKLSNLLYPTSNGLVTFLDPSITANSLLSDIEASNKLDAQAQVSVLSTGFYAGKNFFSLSIGARVQSQLDLPDEFFHFAKRGMEDSGKSYDLAGTTIKGMAFAEIGVGYSREITDRLTVGMRVKFLAGFMNYKVNYSQLDLHLTEQEWQVESQGEMDVVVRDVEPKYDEDMSFGYTDLDINSLMPSGHGYSMDFGVTYSPIKRLTTSLAVTDLGAIWWKEDHTLSANSIGEYSFTGAFDVVNGTDKVNPADKPQFDDITKFKEVETREQHQRLFTKLNAGVEYDLLLNKLAVGVMSSTSFGSVYSYTDVLASITATPTRWFTASLGYSFVDNYFDSFAFALNFHPSWINIFIGTDNFGTKITPQCMPVESKKTNLQVGISVPISRRIRTGIN